MSCVGTFDNAQGDDDLVQSPFWGGAGKGMYGAAMRAVQSKFLVVCMNCYHGGIGSIFWAQFDRWPLYAVKICSKR